MNVWLIHLGELLPVDGDVRPFRYSLLADALTARGHQVIRWAPTFVHAYKKYRSETDRTVRINDSYQLKLLHVRGYRRNIGLGRLRFHRAFSRAFALHSREMATPSLLLTGMPTPESCRAALRYGLKRGIPVVVDVRDIWPDIYLTAFPDALKGIARLFLKPAFQQNRQIFRDAAAILAVSKSYLDWGLSFAHRAPTGVDHVFPLGYPESRLSDEEFEHQKARMAQLGIDPCRVICCFFGQFEATYDIETVISAAWQLQSSGNTEVQFVLCGGGAKLESLRRATRGLQNVVFTGWVSHPMIQSILRISALGLAPYAQLAPQSLPNKPIEYLSGGLPVVGSLRGELAKLLEEYQCGVSYEPGNSAALAKAIRTLATDSAARTSLAKNAQRLYEARFRASKVYAEMAQHLEMIARPS